LLAAADAVVVPSPLESLNKVCMEAAAVGTPFIVTETTGISAWVPQEGVGIVVPPRNPAVIAWAIEEIVAGHFAYDAAAAARFAQQFSPRAVAEQVLAFYREVAGR
jgi:glycosyltransferase involved in cell wall biosynthesis